MIKADEINDGLVLAVPCIVKRLTSLFDGNTVCMGNLKSSLQKNK
jgi:glycine cleavage system regulatory protein